MGDGKEARKHATRERILDSGARLFRERGVAGAGIAEIMKDAGLTHGGFYAHFADKAAFVDAAFERAMDRSRARWTDWTDEAPEAEKPLTLIRRYLSRDHRDDASSGCPIPAFGGELARDAAAAGPGAQSSILKTVEMLERQIAETAKHDEEARGQAIALLALCAGGVTLARCVDDEALSDQILEACRAEAKRLAEPRPRRSSKKNPANSKGADGEQ